METTKYIVREIKKSTIPGNNVILFKDSKFSLILPTPNILPGDIIKITKIKCKLAPIIQVKHNDIIIKTRVRKSHCRKCISREGCTKKLELDSKFCVSYSK